MFTTERLYIEKWDSPPNSISIKDFDFLRSVLTPTNTKYLPDGWQNLTSEEQLRTWFKFQLEEGDLLKIWEREMKEDIGMLFLNEEAESHIINIGYIITKDYWGKGYGTELIRGLIHWSRTTENYSTLRAGVVRENTASRKILEKNQFQLDKGSTGDHLFFIFEI